MSDTKQASLNVLIHDEDRDYLHFLWYDGPFEQNQTLLFYIFSRLCLVLLAHRVC